MHSYFFDKFLKLLFSVIALGLALIASAMSFAMLNTPSDIGIFVGVLLFLIAVCFVFYSLFTIWRRELTWLKDLLLF